MLPSPFPSRSLGPQRSAASDRQASWKFSPPSPQDKSGYSASPLWITSTSTRRTPHTMHYTPSVRTVNGLLEAAATAYTGIGAESTSPPRREPLGIRSGANCKELRDERTPLAELGTPTNPTKESDAATMDQLSSNAVVAWEDLNLNPIRTRSLHHGTKRGVSRFLSVGRGEAAFSPKDSVNVGKESGCLLYQITEATEGVVKGEKPLAHVDSRQLESFRAIRNAQVGNGREGTRRRPSEYASSYLPLPTSLETAAPEPDDYLGRGVVSNGTPTKGGVGKGETLGPSAQPKSLRPLVAQLRYIETDRTRLQAKCDQLMADLNQLQLVVMEERDSRIVSEESAARSNAAVEEFRAASEAAYQTVADELKTVLHGIETLRVQLREREHQCKLLEQEKLLLEGSLETERREREAMKENVGRTEEVVAGLQQEAEASQHVHEQQQMALLHNLELLRAQHTDLEERCLRLEREALVSATAMETEQARRAECTDSLRRAEGAANALHEEVEATRRAANEQQVTLIQSIEVFRLQLAEQQQRSEFFKKESLSTAEKLVEEHEARMMSETAAKRAEEAAEVMREEADKARRAAAEQNNMLLQGIEVLRAQLEEQKQRCAQLEAESARAAAAMDEERMAYTELERKAQRREHTAAEHHEETEALQREMQEVRRKEAAALDEIRGLKRHVAQIERDLTEHRKRGEQQRTDNIQLQATLRAERTTHQLELHEAQHSRRELMEQLRDELQRSRAELDAAKSAAAFSTAAQNGEAESSDGADEREATTSVQKQNVWLQERESLLHTIEELQRRVAAASAPASREEATATVTGRNAVEEEEMRLRALRNSRVELMRELVTLRSSRAALRDEMAILKQQPLPSKS